MAKLVDCKDCGHTVSERAKSCPNCGVSDPGIPDPSAGTGCLTLLLFIIVVGGVIYWLASQETSPPTPEQAARELSTKRYGMAILTAQNAIKQTLKAPSTASFSSYSETESGRLTGTENQWVVRGYVDAENSFGAKIRTKYQVIVEFEPGTDDVSHIVKVDEL